MDGPAFITNAVVTNSGTVGLLPSTVEELQKLLTERSVLPNMVRSCAPVVLKYSMLRVVIGAAVRSGWAMVDEE
jgi:hypothetical protein